MHTWTYTVVSLYTVPDGWRMCVRLSKEGLRKVKVQIFLLGAEIALVTSPGRPTVVELPRMMLLYTGWHTYLHLLNSSSDILSHIITNYVTSSGNGTSLTTNAVGEDSLLSSMSSGCTRALTIPPRMSSASVLPVMSRASGSQVAIPYSDELLKTLEHTHSRLL